jgi:hypothetical protein
MTQALYAHMNNKRKKKKETPRRLVKLTFGCAREVLPGIIES